MQGEIRKCSGIPVITVESSEERHQQIILSTITKRAHQIFEERERKHGFGLDDWLAAERELWREDDATVPDFSLVVDGPRGSGDNHDPEPDRSQPSGLSKQEETRWRSKLRS